MDLARITRTVIAVILITAWAGAMMFSHINPAFFNVLLFAPSLIQRDASFFRQNLTLDRARLMALIGLLALIGIAGLLAFAYGEDAMTWFVRSPYFVLPVWLSILWAIVRPRAEPASASPHGLSRPATARTPAKPAASAHRAD